MLDFKIKPFSNKDFYDIYMQIGFENAKRVIGFIDYSDKIIGLGVDEENVIPTLWHETMHEIIFKMFDSTKEAREISHALDTQKFCFKLREHLSILDEIQFHLWKNLPPAKAYKWSKIYD